MTDKSPITIMVKHRFIDNYHVFTSDDVYGLYVAGKDAEATYDSVAPTVQKLLEWNENIICEVEAAMSFKEYKHRTGVAADIPHPAIIQDRQFVVRHVN